MKFVFRLEAPLRLAHHAEEQAKRALGQAMGILDRHRTTLQTLRDDLESETLAQSIPRSGQIWIQGQNLFLEWTQGQKRKISTAIEAIREAEARVEEARVQLVEKRRAVEVFERLKQRRHAQWKLELSRKELAESSDMAGRRWMAQRRTV